MENKRYSRQELFRPIGKSGQEMLSQSCVLIVGAGAIGTVLANQLTRAGIGNIRIVDRDVVELSNLHRQMLYTEQDVQDSLPKAVAVERRLKAINSTINIEGIVASVTKENVYTYLEGIDVVLDGTDNFDTRFLLNDACYQKGIPFVYGGAVGSRGMTALFIPGSTPCFRCLFSTVTDSNETCDTVGVIAPIVDMIASIQVTEAIKYLTGNLESLHSTLKTFDIWRNERFNMKLNNVDPNCPTCQQRIFPSLEASSSLEFIHLCGRNTVQVQTEEVFDLQIWNENLSKKFKTRLTPFLLRVTINDDITLVLFPDGRLLIEGAENIEAAKMLFEKYIKNIERIK